MQTVNPETHEETHDLMMHRMNADMQKINNAANFARQATLANVVDDINTSGYVSDPDAYTETFNRAYSIGLEIESQIEEHIKAKAASYEAEMRLLLESAANQPRIELPEKRILMG